MAENQNAWKGCACGCLVLFVIALFAPAVKKAREKAGEVRAKKAAAEKSEEGKWKMKRKLVAEKWGSDPLGFQDAGDMYKTAPTVAFDPRAEELIHFLDKEFENGTLPEAQVLREPLEELNVCRHAPEVLAALGRWAPLAAESLQKVKRGTPVAVTAHTNVDYRLRNWRSAHRAYRSILERDPPNLDARNNLGLTLMHMGNDLAALLHFRMLGFVEPKYLPAQINATVALERLGLSAKARELALDAAKRAEKTPQAAFNAAWYHNLSGNYSKSEELVKPFLDLDLSPKFETLQKMNAGKVGKVE